MNEQTPILKDYRTRRKQKIVELMGGKCICCGYNKCIQALELHHLNPKEKEISLSNYSIGWDKIVKELEKCILVCSNCHREIHYGLIDVTTLVPGFKQEILLEIDPPKEFYCKRCGKKLKTNAIHCRECIAFLNRKVDRPTREELKNDIRILPMTKVGEKYGVSDNAVRKWCDAYNLPRRSTDIKAIPDEKWDLI